MFEYEFMRLAFLAGGLTAIIIPIIGVTIVFKRLSMIGDALSHVSLSGITIGLILGVNPLVGAIVASLIAVISIEFIQRKFGKYHEMAISIIMSAGIGLSAVLLGFVDNPANFNSFLFGSIISITNQDLGFALVLTVLIVIGLIKYYREFLFISFDEVSARLSGIDVKKFNIVFMIATALVVSIASRIVGALIVSSLMVIPTATALQFSKSYKSTMLYSIFFSLLFMWTGLTISFYLNLAPGGTIVLTGIVVLCISIIASSLTNKGQS